MKQVLGDTCIELTDGGRRKVRLKGGNPLHAHGVVVAENIFG